MGADVEPQVRSSAWVGDDGDLRAQMRALASKWRAEGEALMSYTTDEDKEECLAALRPTHEERLDRFTMLHNCAVDVEMLASGQLRLEVAGRRADDGKSPTIVLSNPEVDK